LIKLLYRGKSNSALLNYHIVTPESTGICVHSKLRLLWLL